MSYNDEHHRRSTRLESFNYTNSAAYFVTICTLNRICLFGDVKNGQMIKSPYGRIIEEEWLRTEQLRQEIRLVAFVIMPNHLHGIVVIVPPDADKDYLLDDTRGYNLKLFVPPAGMLNRVDMARHVPTHIFGKPEPSSLSTIIGAFKSASSRRINKLRNTPGAPLWQNRFYDRILRNEREWNARRQYIELNPARWQEDKDNPDSAS